MKRTLTKALAALACAAALCGGVRADYKDEKIARLIVIVEKMDERIDRLEGRTSSSESKIASFEQRLNEDQRLIAGSSGSSSATSYRPTSFKKAPVKDVYNPRRK